jgi:hypothetical protein
MYSEIVGTRFFLILICNMGSLLILGKRHMKNLFLFILTFSMNIVVGTTSLYAEYQKFRDWNVASFYNGDGGIAYTSNKNGIPYVAVSCFEKTRNIVMVNFDFENYADNRKMLVKIKKTSKSPTIVFNDDYNNQYKLQLSARTDGGQNEYKMVLGSTLTLPSGKVLKNLEAFNKMKNLIMSNSSIWVGYADPKTGEYNGMKYSLSGSTAAIKKIYKMGNCE